MPRQQEEKLDFEGILQLNEVTYDHRPMTLRDGIDAAIGDVVKSCHTYQKTGEVTIKLKFLPSSQRNMAIASTVTAKEPEPGALSSRAYTDSAGTLRAEDPDQMKLPVTPFGKKEAI